MDDAGLPQLSGDLQDFSSAAIEDIPVAVREGAGGESPAARRGNAFIWVGVGVGAIALLTVGLVVQTQFRRPSPATAASAASDILKQAIASRQGDSAASSLLGHFPYEEAPQADLQPITPDGSLQLRRAAAEKYLEMVAAARAAGVNLLPISSFRSIDDQNVVFFDVKAERGQGATKRAEVSAPPGYSEHHTGYAVDIGDGDRPDTHLQTSFEQTPAFAWLNQNAAHFNFELSFPRDNSQGVSYEPWHWRFVGNRHSLETFYRARTATLQN